MTPVDSDDEILLLHAFETIEARISTVPPLDRRPRRVSEMTTVDAKRRFQRRISHVSLPSNYTAEEEVFSQETESCDSLFNSFFNNL